MRADQLLHRFHIAMIDNLIRRAVLAVGATCALTAFVPLGQTYRPPPIKHVFVIVLENQAFATTFGPHSPAPYLAYTLRRAGAFLPQYYGTGHSSLDNYISMVAGIGVMVST